MAEEEAERVTQALDEVEAITDPVRRARALSEVMKDLRERSPRMTEDRRATVRRLRDVEKLSLRAIAAEVGVSLGTVQDILRGHTGSWGGRPKSGDAE